MQFGLTSPFASKEKSEEKNIKEVPVDISDFSIRTMQDDLLGLNKKPSFTENLVSQSLPEKRIPTPPSVPEKLPVNTTSPFGDKPVLPSKKEDFGEVYAPKPTNIRFIIILIIIALVVIGVSLIAYYFLKSDSSSVKNVPSETAETVAPQQSFDDYNPVTKTDLPVATEKYSSENPNYLVLDIATLSSEEIKTKLSDTAKELLLDSAKQVPYEFTVVDANNNPIAFPIFATAIKLNLSASILSSLGEKFSLFIYGDSANTRLSLAIDIIKTDILKTELLKQEKTFIPAAMFLFMDETPKILNGAFKDSLYKNVPIRFFNVNSQITMSIDYAFINNKLIIATSKNTMRAMIDKLTAATTPSQSSQTVPMEGSPINTPAPASPSTPPSY